MSTTLRFVDAEGFAWQVCEIRPAPTRTAVGSTGTGDGWLYFLSRVDTLRLAHYPADWWSHSAAELETLRRHAQAPRATAPAMRERRSRREVRSDAR